MIINKHIPYLSVVTNKTGSFVINSQKKPITEYIEFLCYEEHSEYCSTNNIYLIEINDHNVLEQPIDNFIAVIPIEIMTKIRNKEVILGIYNAPEAIVRYKTVDLIYAKLIIEADIPESQILLIGGSYDYKTYIIQLSQRLNKQPIKLEYESTCAIWLRHQVMEYTSSIKSSLIKNNTKRKFLFLNKNSRIHRFALFCLLHQNRTLEYSFTSFLQSPNLCESLLKKANELFADIDITLTVDELKEKLPLELDMNINICNVRTDLGYMKGVDFTRVSGTEYAISLIKYYSQTYFSVVTETLYHNTEPRILTEKTFKPIAYKHPFVLVSCPNSLEMLRFLGFKTFHPLINEDYDLETNDCKRLLMIADEVKRLCNLSELELKHFKEQALEIVEYNYNHLMTANLLNRLL